MSASLNCPLAGELARRIRDARDELGAEWLVRISERVALQPMRVFPSDELLDHIPLLLTGIADHLENPAETVAADSAVLVHAMEFGALRYAQGFDESEVLKEFEILGSILLTFCSSEADQIEEPCTLGEALVCAQRVHHAISIVHQAAVTQFLQLLKRRLGEREERLQAFNRALSHEFRNRIGAADGAAQLLELPSLDESERRRLHGVIARNLTNMRGMIANLVELSHMQRDTKRQRQVRLPAALNEVTRLLQDAADEKEVTVRIADGTPDVEVSTAVELVISNLLGNAIKYANMAERDRWVEVRARLNDGLDHDGQTIIVEVADNGLGVPVDERGRIFERFYRASNAEAQVEGSGLGLTIVYEVITSLGGRAWAEFPQRGGSVFAFSIPVQPLA